MRIPLQVARRRGYGLVEITASALILVIALSTTVVALSRLAQSRQMVERRQLAQQAVANEMERFLARPWSKRTQAEAKSISLSPSVQSRLPGAVLTVEVTDAPGKPAGRKVSIEIRWEPSRGNEPVEPPVRLTAWSYPVGSDQP